MTRPHLLAAFTLLAASCAVSATFLAPGPAQACATIPRSAVEAPSLEVEQVLVIHDPRTATEHFIRQLTFGKDAGAFGFVVPVPARPEVAKVDGAPFARLGDAFPFDPPPPASSSGCLLERSESASAPMPSAGVSVLSEQRIGSFTAFVLDASDAAALTRWLADNAFEPSAGTLPWLAHYTALHFFYVALRFEPPANGEADGGCAAREVSAETLRISFASPLPYYPYLEPDPTAAAGSPSSRVLAVWTVAPEAATPVAVRADATGPHWVRPWLEGAAAVTPRATLAATLGEQIAPLLPGTGNEPLVVQTFEDQKTSRHGWGDVVLVPRSEARAPAPVSAATLAPLLDGMQAVIP